jgi:hypothetical protein
MCSTSTPAQGDLDALASLDRKLSLIHDCVAAVVHSLSTGLYLYGTGGLGKSYSVHRQLEGMVDNFHLLNTRITAKGLFVALEKHPDGIHVLEDVERLTDDRDAQSVLRSALWAQPGKDRVATWVTAEGERRCVFRGGVIMLANRALNDLPELRALMTRIAVHKVEITDREMSAQMRRIAGEGFERGRHKLTPEESLGVCDFLIAECKKAQYPPDLRLFDHACLHYIQHKMDISRCHWHDHIVNRIKQSINHFRHGINLLTREERLALDRQTVREIIAETADPKEQVALWTKQTGKSQSTYYARKREVESGEFDL